MPRKPSIWLRESDGFYYTTFQGKQQRLSRDREEAGRAFHALHARAQEERRGDLRPTLRRIVSLYLGSCQRDKSPATHDSYRFFLEGFCGHVGASRRVADLKVADVSDWIASQKWGHNSRVAARSTVKGCLNWAVGEGLLDSHPLGALRIGTPHRRSRILSPEERDKILAAVRDGDFRNLLTFLQLTGTRPFSEAAQLTAGMIDFREGVIDFHRHKNAGKGKQRRVYLTPELVAFLEPLCRKRPSGLLFRTPTGRPFTKSNSNDRVRALERKLGLKRFSLNVFRKSYITEALERGLSSDIVAELCGNSPPTITKYYNLLSEKRESLKAAARKALGL